MHERASHEIRSEIAEHEAARTDALRAVDELAGRRRDLLLGASDKAGDKALADHDAAVQRERRNVERAEAHLAELRPALERAEVTEQAAAVAELFQHGVDLVMEYRRIAEGEYVEAAKVLADVLRRLDNLRFDAERVAAALPRECRLAPVEAWRRHSESPWRLAALPEAVRLPALIQGAKPIWDADFRKPAFQRVVSSSVPVEHPTWDPKPIRVERPNEAQELKRIHERADAEHRGRIASLADIGRAPNP